jgi:lipid A disaccharide synthetase
MHGPATAQGVGGDAMQQQGLNSLFPSDELAVMGLVGTFSTLSRRHARVYTSGDFLRDVARGLEGLGRLQRRRNA